MKKYNFFAFISYRHTDVKAARRLQSLLESYSLPTELLRKLPDAPRRFKVFRDSDELTSGVLSEELQRKLEDSKFLIVICSPDSAQSKYVGEEIEYFRSLGRERRIIPFIIDGSPHSVNECFHPQLTIGGLELLGIDVQTENAMFKIGRFHKAFIRVVAKMLDLDFDVLWNRRKRSIIRKTVAFSVLSMATIAVIAYFALKANNERPFDSTITLEESGTITSLPLSSDGRDSIYVYLDVDEVRRLAIESLHDELSLANIPGMYKGRSTRIVCDAFGCIRLDTIVNMNEKVNLTIRRDVHTYGRIWHYVMENDGITPVVNATFSVGSITAETDDNGLLDMCIPLTEQKPSGYDVDIIYKGQQRKVAFQKELDPALDRTEPTTIMLE